MDYLRHACERVLTETGLLPHANAGAIAAAPAGGASGRGAVPGMMIESLRDTWSAPAAPRTRPRPAGWPRWTPRGSGVPFTTGILVGMGENESDRVHALRAHLLPFLFLPSGRHSIGGKAPRPGGLHSPVLKPSGFRFPSDIAGASAF